MKRNRTTALCKFPGVLLGLVGFLAGCGGGGEIDVAAPGASDSYAYTKSAYQSPNYHPYITGSHVYLLGETVHIGADVEPREMLRRVATENGIHYFLGASRDGVGVDRLLNFSTDLKTRDGTVSEYVSNDGFYPFRTQPAVWVDEEFLRYPEIAQALTDSIRILNDALPPEFQLDVAGTFKNLDSSLVNAALLEGNIAVRLAPRSEVTVFCGESAVACAVSNIPSVYGGYTSSATLVIPNDFDTSQYTLPRTVLVPGDN